MKVDCSLVDKWKAAFSKTLTAAVQARWTDLAMFGEVSHWGTSFRALLESRKGCQLFKVLPEIPGYPYIETGGQTGGGALSGSLVGNEPFFTSRREVKVRGRDR